MRFIHLSGIGIPVSVVCLGCGPFGTSYGKRESYALMDAFVESGGSFFDTAHIYADWIPGGSGASERTLGAWIKRAGVRDKVIVATKGAHPKLETMHIPRMSAADIAQDLTESLERLQTDYIDLYWLHRDDRATPVAEIIDTLNEHIHAGTIHAIGASNWLPDRLAEAAEYASKSGKVGFCASQISWSLAKHPTSYDPASGMVAMDDSTMQYTLAGGPRVIPYSAQANGFFSRPYAESARRMPHYALPINRERRARVQLVASRYGYSPNAVAFAYILNHPASGCGIAGPHTQAQLADTLSASDIELSAKILRYLEGPAHIGLADAPADE